MPRRPQSSKRSEADIINGDEVEQHFRRTIDQDESSADEQEDMSDEGVFDLQVPQSSDESSDDDASSEDEDMQEVTTKKGQNGRQDTLPLNSDSDEESDDEEREMERITAAWGKKKSMYYDADAGDAAEDSDEEKLIAADEEAEAKRLKAKQAKELDEADFGFDEEEVEEEMEVSRNTPKKSRKSNSDKLNGSVSSVKSSLNGEGVERVRKDLSKLSRHEKLEAVMSDAPELLGLLEEFGTRISEVRGTVEPILKLAREQKIATTSGIQYLEVKHQLLLSYITHLTFYLMLKTEGHSVRDHPVMERLVELRTMIERSKPIDTKLKYQIDRLVKAATRTTEDAGRTADASFDVNDAMLKPNISALMARDGGVDAAADGEGVYVPVKRTAVMYEDDEAAARAKKERAAKRAQERLQQSRMYADLREEFSERPEELQDDATGVAAAGEANSRVKAIEAKLAKMEEERRRYEEDNFVRLTMSKAEKKLRKQVERERRRVDVFGDMEDFGDLEAVGDDEDERGALNVNVSSSTNRKGRTLQEYMDELNGATPGKKRRRGELVEAEQRPTKQPREFVEEEELEGVSDIEDSLGEDYDDEDATAALEAAKEAKAAKQERKLAKKAERQRARAIAATNIESDDEAKDKRKASRTIVRNKGLIKHRKKIERNPRVHNRLKAEKREKRRKGQVAAMRTGEADTYGGEATGIRTSVTKSRQIL